MAAYPYYARTSHAYFHRIHITLYDYEPELQNSTISITELGCFARLWINDETEYINVSGDCQIKRYDLKPIFLPLRLNLSVQMTINWRDLFNHKCLLTQVGTKRTTFRQHELLLTLAYNTSPSCDLDVILLCDWSNHNWEQNSVNIFWNRLHIYVRLCKNSYFMF